MMRDSLNGTRYNPNIVQRTKTVFDFPLKYKKEKSDVWQGKPLIFTSSLTDVFHPAIDSFRNEMWDIIRACPHLIFQILTKRPERIKECTPLDLLQADNIWFGTSVGNKDGAYARILQLSMVDCKTSFLSIEPLWENFDLRSICIAYGFHPNWVIVGGESGNENGKYRYRPCELQWITNVVSDCKAMGIPVFVKQLGTHISKQMGLSDRHGANIEEFPEHLRVREFPEF